MATLADTAVVVHVAGPVEEEKVGNQRRDRQRCLRCDMLLWDARRRVVPWLLGQRIAIPDDPTLTAYVVERAQLARSEAACEPRPL
jgi:hypothetical protein